MKDRKYIDDILARQAYTGQDMPKKDPFDKGIMRAVKSAKESLAMDDDQEDRALRNSMLSFGEAIGQMPRAKGFLANFAQAGRALGPALKTHDAYEDEAKNINRQAIGQAQQFRAAEDARAAQLEQQAYAREMADRQRNFQDAQLAEQKDFHRQSLLSKFSKSKEPVHAKSVVNNNLKFLEKKREQNITDNALVATLDDLEKSIKEAMAQGQVGSDLRSASKRTYARYITGENKAADLANAAKYAYFARIKEAGGANPSEREMLEALKTVPTIEKNPEAALEQLNIDRENAKKRMAKYNIIKQNMEANEYQGFPDDYLGDNKQDIVQMPSTLKNDVKAAPENKSISMQDPETGEEYLIPMSKMQESLDDGLMIVE